MTQASSNTVEVSGGGEGRHAPLFDVSGIDLSARRADRDAIAELNPHRHEMALLDAVVWVSDDLRRAVGLVEVRDDQFWVRGHFPGMPMFPGVLMVEAGAQVACYLWNLAKDKPSTAAFLRIEDVAFRRSVIPGEDLYILIEEVKNSRRRFVTDVQGRVGDETAFSARISGMIIGGRQSDK
ncbi:MAG: 3-hydroxyacyl-ACP dehydratase FabZ family protein [Planctomycetota bacterium]